MLRRSAQGQLGVLVGAVLLLATALDRPRSLRAARSSPVPFAAYLTTTPLPPLDPTPYGETIVPGPPQPTPERAGDAITSGRVEALREALVIESPEGPPERVLGFTPAGDRMVSVLGADLVIRSLPDGQQIDRIADVMPSTSGYGWTRIAPDGQLIAIGGERGPGDIELWSLGLGRRLRQHRGGNSITNLAFSSDGRALLAARGDGPVHRWDLASGSLLADLGLPRTWDAAVMAVHPTLARVALGRAGDTLVRLVDLASGATIENRHLSGSGTLIDLSWRPDGDALAAVYRIGSGTRQSHRLALWTMGQESIARVDLDTRRYSPLAWRPDGSALALEASDGAGIEWTTRIALWRGEGALQPIFEAKGFGLQGMAWARDARLLAVSVRQVYQDVDGRQPSWTQLLDTTSGAAPDRTWLLPDRTQAWFTPDGSGLWLAGDADAGQPGLRLYSLDPEWLAARRAWLPRILRSARVDSPGLSGR